MFLFYPGSCLEVKGARNYTSNSLLIGTDEMFEDIVVRGLRSDGLSSKLGVKNNRQTIGKVRFCFLKFKKVFYYQHFFKDEIL